MTQHNSDIVIIGGGIAAVSAAEAARKFNDAIRITILSQEEDLPYHRIRVGEILKDATLSERLILHTREWYDERRLDVHLNCTITDIDPDNKCVRLADGTRYAYDKLIIATGSRSFMPPIQGNDHPNVHSIWTMNDAKRLKQALESAQKVAVIGGGLLGLEAAWQLNQCGKHVTVLEFLPRLLGRQLNETASDLFLKRIEGLGVHVLTGVASQEIVADGDQIRGIALQDGRFIDADLVVVATGVQAQCELAAKIGLKMGRRIVVNDHCETSQADIYGAGDVVELEDGTWYGLWQVAQQEGRTAGTNAAGGDMKLMLKAPPYMLNTMNTRLISAGVVQGADLDGKIVEESFDEAQSTYSLKVYTEDHILKGFILLGDIAEQMRLLQQLQA